uniref:DUF4776 domain-containing protein n=1 Tax=Anopheles farauti TaxID=69004 RepID=A0A182QWD6_9DIPT
MVLNIEPNETIGETVVTTRHERRSSCTESFSLTILIKFLKLNDRSDDEHFRLSLHCGGESVSASGTLDSLNKTKLGNVVGLLANGENFMRFLRESTVEVRLSSTNSIVYKGELRLSDTKVMKFDPSREGGTMEEENFPIYDGHNVAGMVSMVLRAERNVPSGDPLDTVDIMYRINDHKQMPADEQEAELRPLLICANCNMTRSPGNSCCEYEIVDGILHRNSKSSTERMIERIKEKVNQVKLDETLGERASGSTTGCESGGVFCNECGGLTITGTTCQAADARSSIQRAPSRAGQGCSIRDNSKSKNGRQLAVKLANRCCERCQACLDWLPDICCCPKCGYKPEKTKTIKFPVPPLLDDLRNPVPSPDRSTPTVHSSGTLLGSSRSCAMCHICQVQCIDCAHRVQQRAETSSSSAVSVAQLAKQMSYRSATRSRPVTRRPERASGEQVVQNGNVSAPLQRPMTSKRSEQMTNVYSAKEKRDAKESSTKKAPTGKGKVSGREIRKSHNAFMRKIKRQNRPNLYSYRFGRRRSSISVGHRSCMKQDPLVPAHMGWRWDICPPGIEKPRPGWCPGAVRQPIKQLMQHFLQCYPMDNLPVSCRKADAFGNGVTMQGDGVQANQKPTLHITKMHGEYTITMNPLKDTETLKFTDDPYLPGKPIKFKLAKDPVLTKLYAMRDTLKRKGLPLCGCKNLAACAHCTDREKRLLAEEIRRTSKALGLSATTTIADIPSDSESELDVEFTPPSAIMRPELRKRDVVVAETQYNVQDFQLKPVAEERATKSKSKAPATRGERNPGRGDAAPIKTQTEAKAGSAGAKAGVSNPKVRLSGGKTAKGAVAGGTKPTEPAARKGGKQK